MDKVTKWTTEEEKYLLENKEIPLKEVAEHLGRKIQSIKDKRQLLGLKKEKIINLKGKTFGRLTVVAEAGRKRRKVTWLCRCICGKEKIVKSTNLISGTTQSCGCYNRELLSKSNIKDLTGKTFGLLVPIEIVGRTKNSQIKWLCQCNCGEKTIVTSSNLLDGNTESCGCTRKLNQRKGIKWEYLVKKYLKFKYENLIYHKRLPNNTIPDFMTNDQKIIFDAKIHDFLKIEVCIEKYSKYAEKIIFICMEKKRLNWKSDFQNQTNVEFLYIEDIVNWIPSLEQKNFFNEIEKINKLPLSGIYKNREFALKETIEQLEREKKPVTKLTIAKKLGSSKKYLSKNTDLDNYLNDYRMQKKEKIETEMLNDLEKVISEKIKFRQKIMVQDIARILLKQKKQYEHVKEQEVWALTKTLSTNKRYMDYINDSKKKLEEAKRTKILETVKKLKESNEVITILKLRELTKLPKNYLYSDEIKNYIDKINK